MGYRARRIIQGQVIVLVGLLITLVSLLLVPMVSPVFYLYFTFDMLAPISWLGSFVVLAGDVVAISALFEGQDRNPFDLFMLGLVVVAGSVGIFAVAGFAQWNPTVNPLWSGAGPKPEATVLAVYGCLQLVTSFVIIARSLPAILGETRRLAHP